MLNIKVGDRVVLTQNLSYLKKGTTGVVVRVIETSRWTNIIYLIGFTDPTNGYHMRNERFSDHELKLMKEHKLLSFWKIFSFSLEKVPTAYNDLRCTRND